MADKKAIPEFDSEESAREFFDANNTINFLEETELEQPQPLRRGCAGSGSKGRWSHYAFLHHTWKEYGALPVKKACPTRP